MNSGRKIAARAGVLALVAGGMTVIAVGPAQADTFSPGNSTPTVASVTTGGTYQPATGGSVGYQIDATVGDADSLLDLNTVVLCLYKTTGGDSTCATPDAQNTMKLTWTRSANTFALLPGSSTWADNVSTTTTYSPTGTSMVVNFKFKVGQAALAGGWTGKVTATDMSAASANGSGTHTVNYFSSITSRASQAFGTVASGATGVTIDNVSDGSIVANASSKVTMLQAAGFTDGTTTAGIATGAAGSAVSATNVALDCGNAATYAGSTGQIRLSTSPATLQTPVLENGTSEAGTTSLVNSCKLINGGRLPVASYSATVTTGVGSSS